MAEQEYEYGITFADHDSIFPFRNHMTKEQAYGSINKYIADGGSEDIFKVIRRPTGNWEYDSND